MTPPTRAFALKEAVADEFAGGSMAFGPEGRTINFEEELWASEETGPEGFIVTSDPQKVTALEAYDGTFKRVSLREAGVGDDEPDEQETPDAGAASPAADEPAPEPEPSADEGETAAPEHARAGRKGGGR